MIMPRRELPDEYENKFASFIEMCRDAKRQNADCVVVQNPNVLGDTYDELVESLSRLADAGLALQVMHR